MFVGTAWPRYGVCSRGSFPPYGSASVYRVFGHTQMKPVEHSDTAESAKEISEQLLKNVASIASERAANLFGLHVLAKNIETNSKNFTRFLVVEKQPANKIIEGNKAMTSMQLVDKPGMLWAALEILKNKM
jgi:prephenate dehydratase